VPDTTDPNQNYDPEIYDNCRQLAPVLRNVWEQVPYPPAHDEVISIEVKPLVERVFCRQQRHFNAPGVVLRLELDSGLIEWFPLRLRHVLKGLLSNAVGYRDTDKGETRVTLALRALASAYELRMSDNGVGVSFNQSADLFQLFDRAAPSRADAPRVGLAMAKLLVEQSGGTLISDSNEGQGASIVAILPRFDVGDFLESTSTSSLVETC
jgi:signal transduction histidine kinase